MTHVLLVAHTSCTPHILRTVQYVNVAKHILVSIVSDVLLRDLYESN